MRLRTKEQSPSSYFARGAPFLPARPSRRRCSFVSRSRFSFRRGISFFRSPHLSLSPHLAGLSGCLFTCLNYEMFIFAILTYKYENGNNIWKYFKDFRNDQVTIVHVLFKNGSREMIFVLAYSFLSY